MGKVLEGYKIIDFTGFLAGPYCGMYLADLGAEVILLENPGSGGMFVRHALPKENKTGRSMYFQNLNRNKKGLTINLKSEEGKEIFTKLVKESDVLLENMRPGVMDKLGFGWEKLHEINDKLIFASISGFGQKGEYAHRPGYDLIAQAMGGSMSITGQPGDDPLRAGIAIGDIMAGLNATIGIVSSLLKRKETGKGQRIDVSLVDSVVSALEAKAMKYLYDGVNPEKTGNRYVTSAPYDLYKAKDKDYVIASGTDKHFKALSEAMGMPELAEDERFIDTPARNKNFQELKDIINKWGQDYTSEECVEIISKAGIPAAPIYTVEDIYNDDFIREERKMFVTVPHEEAGDLTVLGNPIKMSEYPVEYNKAAPDLGENNDQILEDLGYSKEDIENFKENGVI